MNVEKWIKDNKEALAVIGIDTEKSNMEAVTLFFHKFADDAAKVQGERIADALSQDSHPDAIKERFSFDSELVYEIKHLYGDANSHIMPDYSTPIYDATAPDGIVEHQFHLYEADYEDMPESCREVIQALDWAGIEKLGNHRGYPNLHADGRKKFTSTTGKELFDLSLDGLTTHKPKERKEAIE